MAASATNSATRKRKVPEPEPEAAEKKTANIAKSPDSPKSPVDSATAKITLDRAKAVLLARGYVWMKRPEYCDCDEFDPGLVRGYKGSEDIACLSCAQKCPRCGEPSSDLEYRTKSGTRTVCYGCAVGDTEAIAGWNSDDDNAPATSSLSSKRARVV